MRYLIIFIYIFLFNSHGHDYSKEGIKVDHPVLKMNSENANIAAGYMEVSNNSNKVIKLVSIEAKIAKKQEIHEVILDNDVYKMRPVKDAIIIEPGEKLIFKPKSYHFMFFNLLKSYKSDEMIAANLVFNNNFKIPVEFKVELREHKHNH